MPIIFVEKKNAQSGFVSTLKLFDKISTINSKCYIDLWFIYFYKIFTFGLYFFL